MTLPLYLAMTPAEIAGAHTLPGKMAWMACHFSISHTGLSNLPTELPPGSVIVLDDWTEPDGHDPDRIVQELATLVAKQSCDGVLLDFQRQKNPQTATLCRQLAAALPCPVGIAEGYARDLDCPVFVSAPDLYTPLTDWLAPWQGREIWLEAALEQETLIITEKGTQTAPFAADALPLPRHTDPGIHCSYHWCRQDLSARFSIQRTREDLHALLSEAAGLGVSRGIGLYQQLQS